MVHDQCTQNVAYTSNRAKKLSQATNTLDTLGLFDRKSQKLYTLPVFHSPVGEGPCRNFTDIYLKQVISLIALVTLLHYLIGR